MSDINLYICKTSMNINFQSIHREIAFLMKVSNGLVEFKVKFNNYLNKSIAVINTDLYQNWKIISNE